MTVGELYDKCCGTCISFYICRPKEEYTSIENKQIRDSVKDCDVDWYQICKFRDSGGLAMIIGIDEVRSNDN